LVVERRIDRRAVLTANFGTTREALSLLYAGSSPLTFARGPGDEELGMVLEQSSLDVEDQSHRLI
jgi:hypothetical protein